MRSGETKVEGFDLARGNGDYPGAKSDGWTTVPCAVQVEHLKEAKDRKQQVKDWQSDSEESVRPLTY